jgi:ribosomal protein S27E
MRDFNPMRSVTRASLNEESFSRKARIPCSRCGSVFATSTGSGSTSRSTGFCGTVFSTGFCATCSSCGFGLVSSRGGAGGRGRDSIIMRTTRSGTSNTSPGSGRGRSISGKTSASSRQRSSEAASDLR